MAVTTPIMYLGNYLGGMEPKLADYILQTRETEEVPNLTNMIFNFPIDLIQQSIEEGISIRKIIARDKIDYSGFGGKLRKYQTVGTAFMYLSPRSIIGDGVGLGKTAEIAALINFLKSKNEITRFMIAVETSALGQTAVELMKFTGLYVIQLPSEAAKIKKAIQKIDWTQVDGIVIKHSALRSDELSKWLALNIDESGSCKVFNTFILDESSVIKNMTTKTAIYTKNICDIVPRVHFMNATTFEINIMDIYNQVDMMNPTLLPKKWRIEKEYCTFKTGTYWTKVNGKAKTNFKRELSGYKNQAEFKDRLKLAYFGRCKKDIGMDMPHIYKVYEVTPTNEQSMALAKGHRYMEVLNCPSLIESISLKTNRETVPKLDRVCSLVENEFKDDNIMIYCWHIEAQKAIYDEMIKLGKRPVILAGGTKDNERFEIQNKFNSGEYNVLITNIQKSLNLYGGDVCIFYSCLTNPAKMEQTRGRIDRNVDDKIKTYVLMLYKGTDEYKFFMDVVKQRAKDARELTIDAKTAVDFFVDSMKESEFDELNQKAGN